MTEAAHRYSYALQRIPCNSECDQKVVFNQLWVHLLLNLSRCKRKMKEYDEAVNFATEVLVKYPKSCEAFQTRAKAHQAAGNLEEALKDLNAAVKVTPKKTELHRILISMMEEIQGRKQVTSNCDDFSDYSGDYTSSEYSSRI